MKELLKEIHQNWKSSTKFWRMFILILQIPREIRIANLVPLVHMIRECGSLIFIVILSKEIEKRIKLPRPSDRSRNVSFLKKDIFLAVIKFVQFEIKFSRPSGCKFRKLNREKRGVSRTRDSEIIYIILEVQPTMDIVAIAKTCRMYSCWWESEHRRIALYFFHFTSFTHNIRQFHKIKEFCYSIILFSSLGFHFFVRRNIIK